VVTAFDSGAWGCQKMNDNLIIKNLTIANALNTAAQPHRALRGSGRFAAAAHPSYPLREHVRAACRAHPSFSWRIRLPYARQKKRAAEFGESLLSPPSPLQPVREEVN
jgi:hypothetical protein